MLQSKKRVGDAFNNSAWSLIQGFIANAINNVLAADTVYGADTAIVEAIEQQVSAEERPVIEG